MGTDSLTIFIPARNEQDSISLVVDDVAAALASHSAIVIAEVILVNDGSSDATLVRMTEAAQKHPSLPIRIINNIVGQGRRRSLVALANEANGRRIMMIGGHHQDRRDAIESILDRFHDAEIIAPYLEPDMRPLTRRLLSQTYTTLVNVLAGRSLRYYNGPSIILIEDILRSPPKNDISFQAEMLLASIGAGRSYVAVPIRCIPRQAGKSHTLKWRSFLTVTQFLSVLIRSRLIKRKP